MNTGHFRVPKRTQKDYTLAFKLQVVDAVEKGDFTYKEAQQHYGIQGRSTVLIWLRKHGRLDWHPKVPSMSKRAAPNKKIKELEKRIKRLEEEKEVLNVAIDIADDMLKTDIRKKYLSLLSSTTSQQQAHLSENDPLAE
jgi:transposase-like protein